LIETKGERSVKPPSSVAALSRFITSFCIDFIARLTIEIDDSKYSACQIFSRAINEAVCPILLFDISALQHSVAKCSQGEADAVLYNSFQKKIAERLDELEQERENLDKNKKDGRQGKNSSNHNGQSESEASEKMFESFENKRNEMLVQQTESIGKKRKDSYPGKNSSDRNGQSRTELTNGNEAVIVEENDYDSIVKATSLLVDVKHIRDELNILNFLLGQQKTVWEILSKTSPDETSNDDPTVVDEGDKWRGPAYAIKLVGEMDNIAQNIQESVSGSVRI
jgi:hypothetical protein